MRSVLAAIYVTVAACGDGLAPLSELARAELRWGRTGTNSYTVDVTRSCYCLPESVGPVTVSVRNGTVESRTFSDGSAVPADLHDSFPDVPGLFALIADALRGGAHVSASYHPVHGAPTEVFIDYEAQMADDEVFYSAAVSIPQ